MLQAELTGQLEKITYSNEENGYTVAKIRVKGHKNLVTVTGNFAQLNLGELLKITGEWHNHPRYGEQFKVITCESVTPATAEGIEKYLGSGLIKGVGPVMAKRIVTLFGADTLEIMEKSIGRLKEVEGIGEKRFRMIRGAWDEHKEIKEVMIFLQGCGVSPAYAARIFKRYGHDAIRKVKENPYRLATDIFGIGFLSADNIAERMGIARDSIYRAEAGILYMLNQLSGNGHVYYPYEPLIEECMKMLQVARDIIVKAFGKIASEKKIVFEDINDDDLSANNKAVYLSRLYLAEVGIAESIKQLFSHQKRLREFDIKAAIAQVENDVGIRLAEKQAEAIHEAITKKVLVITGGPGTGKTTIINSILKVYAGQGQRVLLAAPTGRASKRMSEATGHEAKTIHRLLEFSPLEGRFKRDAKNPLNADLIVIDEASMVDTILMHYLLNAVPLSATLIFVGDVDQLPSVGSGNVLRDIITSGSVPTVMLNEIFRQAGKSLIVTNAHIINSGNRPSLSYNSEELQDFYFLQVETPEKIVERIISLCRDRIPERFRFDPVKDIQVLAPMNRGMIGTINLNIELQKALNPAGKEMVKGYKTFKTGDKVMQVVNNYDKDVFNGDIGLIKEIDNEYQKVLVDYDGRTVAYESRDIDEIVLAYAVSVHKSQGSEYPAVIMPVHTQHYLLLQRNLLYTGITRGKRLVILIGTRKALSIAINNNTPRKRYSWLQKRLE